MLAEIGLTATIVAFAAAVYATIAGFYGGYRHNARLVLSARNAAIGTLPLLLLACGALLVALMTEQYQINYVRATVDPQTPAFYRFTALWGAQQGSLLFWSLTMSVFVAAALLINWRSASDSEVTPQAFRDLELGRIVGNPTAAAVIATGSYGLINGGSIRTPGSLVVTYDPTKPNNFGINLENFGVAPDVWAVNSPEDELRGFDRELKAAVDEALRMLSEGRWQYVNDANGRN